jgi:hypothetical protein
VSDSNLMHRREPRRVDARQRLRDAQAAETSAVTAVYASETALARAVAKRDAAYAAATVAVEREVEALRGARGVLIKTSGLDRAALLLGMSRGQLRQSSRVQRD